MTRSRWLSLFFSQPKKLIAVDFARGVVRLLAVERTLQGIRLKAFAVRKPLPDQPYADQAQSFIKEFIQTHKIRCQDVLISLSDENEVFIKYLVLPSLPQKEVQPAAKWQMKDDAPFDVENATWDWQYVSERTDEQGVKHFGVVFCCAKKEAVDQYLRILANCRLRVVRVTSAAFDYQDLLSKIHPQEPLQAVLDIDEQHSFLSVYVDQKLTFFRQLPLSREQLILAMTQTALQNREMVKLTAQEAEQLLTTAGVPLRNTDDPVLAQKNHFISMMRPLLEAMVREIRFSLAYVGSTIAAQKISTIYVSGAGGNLRNLAPYLQFETGIKAAALVSSGTVTVAKGQEENFSRVESQLARVLGAVLNDGQGIDLLPEDLKERDGQQLQWMVLRLVTIAGFAVLMLAIGLQQMRQRHVERQLQYARIHLQATEVMRDLNHQALLRQELWRKIVVNKVPGQGVLKLISDIIPADVILNEISFDQTRGKVKISGVVAVERADAGATLIDFVQRLEETDYFLSATLLSSRKVNNAEEFEISCELGSGI